jgi:Transposase DDE domain
MIDRIIAIYCICDDFFRDRAEHWPNIKMTEAEVMTTFILAHTDFYGNIEKSRTFLMEHGYIPRMLGKSQFCRRSHRWSKSIWQELIQFAALKGVVFGLPDAFVVDSFPVRVCQSIRMHRARLFGGTEFKGYNACRHEYFRGLKIHAVVTTTGRPLIVWATPGCVHDLRAYKERAPWIGMNRGCATYGDAAYLDEALEKMLEIRGQKLIAARRENTKRPLGVRDFLDLQGLRKVVETTFSRVAALMPRKIHAVTEKGFEMKAMGFITAVSMIFAIS